MKEKKLTLTLDFSPLRDVIIRIKGIRLNMSRQIIRYEWGQYAISPNDWDLDNRTAKIKPEVLIKIVKDIYVHLKFDKVVIKEYYPDLTAKELLEKIITPS